MTRVRKEPGPAHPISIEPHARRVRVFWNGRLVAETDQALVMKEASYQPVFYLPRASLKAEVLRSSVTKTYCPYKGEASYLTLADGDRAVSDAIWIYQEPYEAVRAIAGYAAFYESKVDRIES